MHPIGLEYLTLYGTHPVDYIRIAAEAGCSQVSLFTGPVAVPESPAHPPSILDDPGLRRDIRAALDGHGISVSLVEGFLVSPGHSVAAYDRTLDLLAELGASRINAVSFDALDRTVDELGTLAEMTAARGVTLTMEPCPLFTIDSFACALDIVRDVANPNLKLLVDTLHFCRSDGFAMIDRIDPALIDYVQICDGPLVASSPEAYLDEALYDRLPPGEGELPLAKVLGRMPDGVTVSAETPMRRRRHAGFNDAQIAGLAVEGTRKVLEAV